MLYLKLAACVIGLLAFLDIYTASKNKKNQQNDETTYQQKKVLFNIYNKNQILITILMIITLLFSFLCPIVDFINYIPDGNYIFYVDIGNGNTTYSKRVPASVGVEHDINGVKYWVIRADERDFQSKYIIPNHATKIFDQMGNDWLCTLTTDMEYSPDLIDKIDLHTLVNITIGWSVAIGIFLWLKLFIFRKRTKTTEQSEELTSVNNDPQVAYTPSSHKKNSEKKWLITCGSIVLSVFILCGIVIGVKYMKDSTKINEAIVAQNTTLSQDAFESEKTTVPKTILPKQKYITLCKSVKYKDVLHYPDKYLNKKVKFTGRVFVKNTNDVSDFRPMSVLIHYRDMPEHRIYTTKLDEYYYKDIIAFYCTNSNGCPNLLNDDIITIYGEVVGANSIIYIDVKYIDIKSE